MYDYEMMKSIIGQRKTSVLMETLNFQERLFERLQKPDFPFIEKLKMLAIIHNNIKEHFSMKMCKRNNYTCKKAARTATDLYLRLGSYADAIINEFSSHHQEIRHYMSVCKIVEMGIVSDDVSYGRKFVMRSDESNNEEDTVIIIVPKIILNISSVITFIEENLKVKPDEQIKFTSNDSKELIITDEELSKGDIVIRTPYTSYDTVFNFIKDRLESPEYNLYLMTLYRVGKIDSPLIKLLCEAAKSQKVVVVYVELKASGDEERNKEVINKLRESGVYVGVNIPYKVHAKMFVAINTMRNKNKYCAHFSTGNYNLSSVGAYTDIQYFTSDWKKIIPAWRAFVIRIMQMKEAIGILDDNVPSFNKIWFSPYDLKDKIIGLIQKEIEKGENGLIILKANSLAEPDIINYLHDAVSAGVRVNLIIRSICLMDPLPCSNLQITSYCGRYLEHDRIYIFGNETYISSADLSFRNMYKRVEYMLKLDEKAGEEVRGFITQMPIINKYYYEKIYAGRSHIRIDECDYMWIERKVE